jgi:hypothetical protein
MSRNASFTISRDSCVLWVRAPVKAWPNEKEHHDYWYEAACGARVGEWTA